MFGLLNEAEQRDSLDPEHYAMRRGRFYLIWNASKISGRPMLVALMAGNAAHDVENTDSNTLLAEINGRFRKVFPDKVIPAPLEVIVTRWKQDPFTRGTYSYVGPQTRPGDYDLMSHPVGNLHFAGEATCGTHPATVHGAFLSGLRVAAEVMESMAGPLELPMPLVAPPPVKQNMPTQYSIPPVPAPVQPMASWGTLNILSDPAARPELAAPFIKQEHEAIPLSSVPPLTSAPAPVPARLAGPPKQSVCAGDASFWVSASCAGGEDLNYEAAIVAAILSEIGDRPVKPSRPGVNPFLLYTKARWDECKAYCANDKTAAGKDPIRATLGRWWKASSDEVKRSYIAKSQEAQAQADTIRREFDQKSAQWDYDARRIRLDYMRDHPPPKATSGDAALGAMSEGLGISKRKTNVSNCVVLDHA